MHGFIEFCLALAIFGSQRPSIAQEAVPYTFHIDHVGCVVNDADFDAIRDSRFLADSFAHVGPGAGRPERGMAYSGLYLWGRLTYLEFLREHDDRRKGDCFLAFNAEAEGSVKWLVERMRERYPASQPRIGTSRIVVGVDTIPAYYAALFDYEGGHRRFGVWALEYDRDFRHRLAPEINPQAGDIGRLKRGAPVAHHPDEYFLDVVGARAVLPQVRSRQVLDLLEVMGFRIERGQQALAVGPDFTLSIAIGDTIPALRAVELSLTRPREDLTVRLGSAEIRSDQESRAIWWMDSLSR